MVEELAGKKGERKGYKQLFGRFFIFFFDFSDHSHDIQFFFLDCQLFTGVVSC